jgi:hypothetical protein
MLRHRLRPPGLVATVLCVGLLPACAMWAPSPRAMSVPSYEMRDRVQRVQVGQAQAAAQRVLGRQPVRKPGHPQSPFPSPLRVLELRTPDGRGVRVETYVVATRPADACPDFQYDDVAVAFVDGAVAGVGWEYVEESWRGWGGSLDALRAARERPGCPEEMEAPQSE